MSYQHYSNRPEKLTASFVEGEYQSLTSTIESAEAASTSDAWMKLHSRWNSLWSYLVGEGGRIGHAYSLDMNDPEREEAEKYHRENISPVMSRGESHLIGATLNSRYQDVFAREFGEIYLRRLKAMVDVVAPINSKLRIEAGGLARQYSKLNAQAEVEIGGEVMTLTRAAAMLQSEASSEKRREIYVAQRRWYLENREQIAGVFDRLVALRQQMSLNLGYENFIPLGYLGMGRVDYGPEEVARFRDNIRRYAVPVLSRLLERQQRELGVETMRPWDAAYGAEMSIPAGVVPVDTQLENAQKVFDDLSPRLGEHFRMMRENGWIDLENRRGKRNGAYCASFPDEGRVVVLCNSTGDANDVRTLMHEMGHAFQKIESMHIEPTALQFPTIDVAEIHSTGMEYLSLPYMHRFFNEENTAKFNQSRWKRSLNLLCSMALGDEFQHWVYANPDATLDERDECWARLAEIYKPGIDSSGYEEYHRVGWYGIPHFFNSPFYFIDYGIAETGAMQLALIDAVDHDTAMDTYLKLCRLGGTKSILEVFDSVRMRSPFEPELMKDLMEVAAEELAIAAQ